MAQGRYHSFMGIDRRLRRLVVGNATYYWTVRQRIRPVYQACSVTLSFYPENTRCRLALVFRSGRGRIISNSGFESGALIRLPDRAYLNLHEPGTVRSLLDAAEADLVSSVNVPAHVDGWPYFDMVVDAARICPRGDRQT